MIPNEISFHLVLYIFWEVHRMAIYSWANTGTPPGCQQFPRLPTAFLHFRPHARTSESNAVRGFIVEFERTLTPRDAPSRRFSTHDRAIGTSRSRAHLGLIKKGRAKVDQAI